MNKPKRRKKVQCDLLGRKENEFLYAAMDNLIEQHHERLHEASISLAWRYGWSADRYGEGMVQISKLVLANDLDREFRTRKAGFDAVLLLNHELFSMGREDDATYDAQLLFALDSALEAMQPQLDDEGEQKRDEKNRLLWRVKKPDIQLHSAVYSRHGCCWQYLAEFRRLIEERADKDRPLLAMLEDADADFIRMPEGDSASDVA